MTDRELMQQALDALTYVGDKDIYSDTIDALRARLSQPEPAECDGGQCGIGGYCKECPKTKPEPEPVAWRFHDRNMWCYVDHLTDLPQDKFKPLYTTPPQREWQTMTENEIKHLWYEACQTNLELTSQLIVHLARNIEAKLKEKNNAI